MGVKKKYWLKIYNQSPQKAAKMFYQKLDRERENDRSWAIAKLLLLAKHPHLCPEPPPTFEPEPGSQPVMDLEYFLRINGGRWGCAMEDICEYEREHGVIL